MREELKRPSRNPFDYVTPEEREANLRMSMAESLAMYDDGRIEEVRETLRLRVEAAQREYEQRLAEQNVSLEDHRQ